MNLDDPAGLIDSDSSVRDYTDEVIRTHERNQFLAKRTVLFLKITIFIGFLTLFLTTVLVIKASSSPVLLTFLNDHIRAVDVVTPNRNPPVTDRQAIHWAADKVSDLLSLHFNKYAEQVSRRKNYFSGDGWSLYQHSLINNDVIKTIKNDGLIITAINKGTPRILQKYHLNGNVNWRIEILILQTIQGASDKTITVKKKVFVTVEETRRDESVEGLKIRVFGVSE